MLRVAEVAAQLKVSSATVRRYVRESELPTIRVSRGTLRVDPAQLEAWLAERQR